MRKTIALGIVFIMYLLSYYLLYTYSLFGFDILFPLNIIIYLAVLFGFIWVIRANYHHYGSKFNHLLLVLFAVLVSFQLTSMYLEPMTRGYVIGASTSRCDFETYIRFGPWYVWKNYELIVLYVRIPGLLALLISITSFVTRKKRDVLLYFYLLYGYIVVLIPYLLILERFMEIGV